MSVREKYVITNIHHPDYPQARRIRALYSFRPDVKAGDLGGFVESEENLSHKGTCWLFDDSLCIEQAAVRENATLYDNAFVGDQAIVCGDAVLGQDALLDDRQVQRSSAESNWKYTVTNIAHPITPWLFRIRALKAFRDDVRPGQLGGYVQSEDNLSQDGTCWIFDDAIVCADAHVSGSAVVRDHAWVHGSSLVSDNAVIRGYATICDHAIISAGKVSDSAFIGGDAKIYENRQTKHAPVIACRATVYGEVSGRVQCGEGSVVLPGMKIINPTPDRFRLDYNGIHVDISASAPGRYLTPPEGFAPCIPKSKAKDKPRER